MRVVHEEGDANGNQRDEHILGERVALPIDEQTTDHDCALDEPSRARERGVPGMGLHDFAITWVG